MVLGDREDERKKTQETMKEIEKTEKEVKVLM